MRFGRQLSVLTVTALAVGALATATALASDASAAPQTVALPASGTVALHASGNGHGHGMSQYGAQGAAIDGLTTRQILAFYYPHTALATLAPSTIRVQLSGAGTRTTVFAATPGLAASGYGVLPTTGYRYFRLAADGSGLRLWGIRPSGAFHSLKTGLPSGSSFSSRAGYVRLLRTDATSTRYRGTLHAVRSGSGVMTVNYVSLDGYAEGVAPREMPSSWRANAVSAQAIAARTYGRNAVQSHGGSAYDICDTTWCQVYGGMDHYDSAGNLLWTDDAAAIANNHNQVLTYGGSAIFAQFSASNGGAMEYGGEPYLPAKADPYDDAASGDPYLGYARTASVSGIASYYGLRTATSIAITSRDGYGPWGGRVLDAVVTGTDYSGSTKRVSTTGSSLAGALGLGTTLFHFDDQAPAPLAPRGVHAGTGEYGAWVSWSAPSNATAAGVHGYQVSWGRFTTVVHAHSAYLSPIYQRSAERVTVRAINPNGLGAAAATTLRGTRSPTGVVPVPSDRLFDTYRHVRVDASHPYGFDVAGAGSLPRAGMRSVQLSVTVGGPTATGVLRVYADGTNPAAAEQIAYVRGRTSVATVSVPVRHSTHLVFAPSRGQVIVLAEQESYTSPSGRRIKPVTPTWAGSVHAVARLSAATTGTASTVSLSGLPGVDVATKAVVVNVQAWTHGASGTLTVWPDGTPRPSARHVAVGPYGSNSATLIVPVTAAHRLRLASSAAGIGARVTLVGLVGNGGGLLESYPANSIAGGQDPSHPTMAVGTQIVTRHVVGVGQIPRTGVAAVLLHVSALPGGTAGKVWVWPTGTHRPVAAAVFFGTVHPQTATVLVPVGTGGTVRVQSSVPGAHVSLDSIGYVTTG